MPPSSSSKKQQWSRSADEFLAAPVRKSKFGRVKRDSSVTSSGSVVPSRKESQDASPELIKQALFSSFLELFLESLPANQREHVKTELYATLGNLCVMPTFFLSDGFIPMRKAFKGLITTVVANCFSMNPNIDSPILPSIGFNSTTSRYLSDFEELEQIGEGGFGSVYKVKCKFDGCMYAMKKIVIKKNLTSKQLLEVMNEVQVLASLQQHENIVRYFSGWVEMFDPYAFDSISSTPTLVSAMQIVELNDSELPPSPGPGSPTDKMKSAIRVQVDDETSEESTSTSEDQERMGTTSIATSYEPSFEGLAPAPINQGGSRFWGGGSGDSESEVELSYRVASSAFTTKVVEPKTARATRVKDEEKRPELMNLSRTTSLTAKPIMYIQMELCNMTLEEYLVDRNRRSANTAFPIIDGNFNRRLTEQLLTAIEYIHQSGLIHRDIKPSNIFLKQRGKKVRFLLGDFGLACFDRQSRPSESEDDCQLSTKTDTEDRPRQLTVMIHHSKGVGTSTYSAPEQLKSTVYGPAVDVYSAGIVIFEAYNTFGTIMERVTAVEALRNKRSLPEKFEKDWPTVAANVLSMTDPDPKKRPTASQLISTTVHKESSVVASLKEIIKNMEKELEVYRRKEQILLTQTQNKNAMSKKRK